MEAVWEEMAKTAIYRHCLNRLGHNGLDGTSEAKFVKCAKDLHEKVPRLFSEVKLPQPQTAVADGFVPLSEMVEDE